MIDLTQNALPNVVEINGKAYSIYTDFRRWMQFEIEAGKLSRGQQLDISYLFKNDMPTYCNIEKLFAFSRPKSVLPRNTRNFNTIVLDYEIDSDYIYAAFMSQYGIDLVDIEYLHWHKFLALLKGLKEEEIICKIMAYRCYEKMDAKKDIYEVLKRQWMIERITTEEQAEIDEFSSLFY